MMMMMMITLFTLTFYIFITVKCKYKEKKMYMSLETEVTKGFLVSLQILCFYGYLREKKTIEGMGYVHRIGEKEHIEIVLVFRMLFKQ